MLDHLWLHARMWDADLEEVFLELIKEMFNLNMIDALKINQYIIRKACIQRKIRISVTLGSTGQLGH